MNVSRFPDCCGAFIFHDFLAMPLNKQIDMEEIKTESYHDGHDNKRTIFAILSDHQENIKKDLEEVGFLEIYEFSGTYFWEARGDYARLTMMVKNQKESGPLVIDGCYIFGE